MHSRRRPDDEDIVVIGPCGGDVGPGQDDGGQEDGKDEDDGSPRGRVHQQTRAYHQHLCVRERKNVCMCACGKVCVYVCV